MALLLTPRTMEPSKLAEPLSLRLGTCWQGLRPGYLLLVSIDSIVYIQVIEAIRAVSKEIGQCRDSCRCRLHLQ